jgi:hypothetical protein
MWIFFANLKKLIWLIFALGFAAAAIGLLIEAIKL